MHPRELARRARVAAEQETRRSRALMEAAVTGASLVANRLRWSEETPVIEPADILPWLRDEAAEPEEDLEAIEAAIIARGQALSERLRRGQAAAPETD